MAPLEGVPDGPSVPLFDLAPGGVYRADRVTPIAGALLPHRFTLTCAVPGGTAIGGLFSVALSCRSPRLAVSQHPALRSPDLPQPFLTGGCLPSGRAAATRPTHRPHHRPTRQWSPPPSGTTRRPLATRSAASAEARTTPSQGASNLATCLSVLVPLNSVRTPLPPTLFRYAPCTSESTMPCGAPSPAKCGCQERCARST